MSTIWREDDKTRIVWITMLASSDAYGKVNASVPGLADAARVAVDECRGALAKLSAPDPDSRSKEYEGRRIKEVDGGWLILNYTKYRERGRSLGRRDYLRIKQQEHRARTKAKISKSQPKSTNLNQCQPIAEAEAEAEAEGVKKPALSFSSMSEQIRADRAFGKCCTRCGSSSKADSGRMTWRESLPWCSLYCYEVWVRAGRPKNSQEFS